MDKKNSASDDEKHIINWSNCIMHIMFQMWTRTRWREYLIMDDGNEKREKKDREG